MKTHGKGMCKVLTACFAVLLIWMLAGCGADAGIEGNWVLTKEILSDGTQMNAKDLAEEGISERYEIVGDQVSYTCEISLMDKPITIDLELEDLGNHTYNFRLPGSFVFATVKQEGNTLTYSAGEGDDASVMIFTREK